MISPSGWWAGRRPPPPPAFDPWGDFGPEDDPARELLETGLNRLDRALTRSGRDREAAFLLLEADGYLTYACEAAAEESRTEELLVEILDRIGSRGR